MNSMQQIPFNTECRTQHLCRKCIPLLNSSNYNAMHTPSQWECKEKRNSQCAKSTKTRNFTGHLVSLFTIRMPACHAMLRTNRPHKYELSAFPEGTALLSCTEEMNIQKRKKKYSYAKQNCSHEGSPIGGLYGRSSNENCANIGRKRDTKHGRVGV